MSLISKTSLKSHFFCSALYTAMISTFILSSAQACLTDCSIPVNFTGVYVDQTCVISINNASNNETVNLPQISIASLQKNSNEAGSRPFDVTLTDCPASREITVFFTSNSPMDSTTGNLINDTGPEYSKNVQVRLRKEDGSQVIIDDSSTGQPYITSPKGDPLSHTFIASYYANGDASVTAGEVRTIAGVNLVYK